MDFTTADIEITSFQVKEALGHNMGKHVVRMSEDRPDPPSVRLLVYHS